MPYKDPEKQRAAEHRWEQTHRKQRREAQYRRRNAQRKRFDEFKATLKCIKCLENHPATLDFHHRNKKQKRVSLGEVVARMDWSWKKIMEEVDLCDVLCANCHRKEHYTGKFGV